MNTVSMEIQEMSADLISTIVHITLK